MAAVRTWERSAMTDAQSTSGEGQLVRQIAAGDREAFTRLYQHYRPALIQYLLPLMGDRRLAEDVLQETMVAAWRGAKQFRGDARVQTWLIAIARRQAYTVLRRHGVPLTAFTETADVAAAGPTVEDHVLTTLAAEECAALLARLPAIHREILVLTFIHGLSYAESATVLAVPVGTVKSRLHQAKRALRLMLTTEEVGS